MCVRKARHKLREVKAELEKTVLLWDREQWEMKWLLPQSHSRGEKRSHHLHTQQMELRLVSRDTIFIRLFCIISVLLIQRVFAENII